MKVFNYYGGPGVGKSTAAAQEFLEWKKKGKKVELVTEVAKDLTWEEHFIRLRGDFSAQILLLAEQNWRLARLRPHGLDAVFTDSPLLLSCVYSPDPTLLSVALTLYSLYDNHNFILERKHPYQSTGRSQTERQAIEIDERIHNLLIEQGLATEILA